MHGNPYEPPRDLSIPKQRDRRPETRRSRSVRPAVGMIGVLSMVLAPQFIQFSGGDPILIAICLAVSAGGLVLLLAEQKLA